jgi:hypothetical protein
LLTVPCLAAPWFWLLNFLAILPALLGPRFRKLDSKGIRPFISLFHKFGDHGSLLTKTLSALVWNHVTFAFLATPLTANNEIWIFRNDLKPFNVLTSVFQHREQVWKPLDSTLPLSPSRRDRHRLHSQALAHVFVGMVTGFAVVVHNHSPPPERNSPLSQDQLSHLDRVFDTLVSPRLVSVVHAPYPETVRIGWATLASIVKPRSDVDRTTTLEALLNPALFDGTIAQMKETGKQEMLGARALGMSTQPEDVPGWGAQWTTSRAGRVLQLLSKCLGDWSEAKTSVSAQSVEVSKRLTRVCDQWLTIGFARRT